MRQNDARKRMQQSFIEQYKNRNDSVFVKPGTQEATHVVSLPPLAQQMALNYLERRADLPPFSPKDVPPRD